MKEQIVMDILREMTAILTQEQLMRLKEVVRVQLCGYDIRKKETALMRTDQNWLNYLQMYLDGFRQNGKSTGTIEQYNLHLSRMLSYVAKNVQDIEDDDLIAYMYKYRALRKVSNRYLNNMRLVFNCFFRWLQRRKVILRNPVDGLEPIKYRQVVKKPLSPEELEKVRCACERERDLAIVEFLYSSAVRVSELCQLNREDVSWQIRNFRYFCKMISVMPLSKFVFFKVYSATVKNRILWRFTQFFSHCISTYNVKIDSVLLQRAAAQITT